MCDSSIHLGWRTGSDVAISSSGTRKEMGGSDRSMEQPSKPSINSMQVQWKFNAIQFNAILCWHRKSANKARKSDKSIILFSR